MYLLNRLLQRIQCRVNSRDHHHSSSAKESEASRDLYVNLVPAEYSVQGQQQGSYQQHRAHTSTAAYTEAGQHARTHRSLPEVTVAEITQGIKESAASSDPYVCTCSCRSSSAAAARSRCAAGPSSFLAAAAAARRLVSAFCCSCSFRCCSFRACSCRACSCAAPQG